MPLRIRTGELTATATYRKREWVWIPADPTHPDWDRRLGNLTIVLYKSRRCGAGFEADTYAVEELPPEHGLIARQFYLLNLTDQDQDEPYLVRIGRVNTCSCMAGRCHRYDCKHRDALAELLLESILPDEYEHPPQVLEAARWAAEPDPPRDFDDEDPTPEREPANYDDFGY